MSNAPTIWRGARAAAAAALIAAAVSGCGIAGALTGAPATPVGGTEAAPVGSAAGAAEPTVQAGICVDGTGSLAAYYATRFKEQVAAAVSGWAAVPPANPSGGVPGQPGLHLVLRSVTTSSYSDDGTSVSDTIPPVPAIAPEPGPGDANYNDDLRAWLAAKPGWQRQATAAVTKARAVAGEVRSYPVARNTYSAIYSCLSGAARELGQVPGASMRLVIMSDFQNNEPVVSLSLSAARVLLVTVCSSYDSTSCPQRFAYARSFVLKHGASQVEEVSADAMTPQTLLSFWRS